MENARRGLETTIDATATSPDSAPVITNGSGPAGRGLAFALALRGIRSVLVERHLTS